jgi:hypothetical protein
VPPNRLPKQICDRGKRFREHPCEDHTSDEANDGIRDHAEHYEAGAAGKATGSSERKRKPKRDLKIATRWLRDVIAVHVRRDKDPDTEKDSDTEKLPTQDNPPGIPAK